MAVLLFNIKVHIKLSTSDLDFIFVSGQHKEGLRKKRYRLIREAAAKQKEAEAQKVLQGMTDVAQEKRSMGDHQEVCIDMS